MKRGQTVAVLFKIPRSLLLRLDTYALQHSHGNRSEALRQGILRLIESEPEQPQPALRQAGTAYENGASGSQGGEA